MGTTDADHDRFRPGGAKRFEPCDAVLRRAGTEAVPSGLHLVRDAVVAFNERAQLAFCLDDIGIDVERGIQTAMEIEGVSPPLLPQNLKTLPIGREGLG